MKGIAQPVATVTGDTQSRPKCAGPRRVGRLHRLSYRPDVECDPVRLKEGRRDGSLDCEIDVLSEIASNYHDLQNLQLADHNADDRDVSLSLRSYRSGMTTNSAGSIAVQVHQARERLAESEARARRLAELIERIDGDGPQARALADAFAIVEDFIAQQRNGIAALEASERDVLRRYSRPRSRTNAG